jgi:hypothetical protein
LSGIWEQSDPQRCRRVASALLKVPKLTVRQWFAGIRIDDDAFAFLEALYGPLEDLAHVSILPRKRTFPRRPRHATCPMLPGSRGIGVGAPNASPIGTGAPNANALLVPGHPMPVGEKDALGALRSH